MEKKEWTDLLDQSNLENYINNNINPNKILTKLNQDKQLGLTYYLLKEYIKEKFKKIWSTEDKKWVDFKANDDQNRNSINSNSKRTSKKHKKNSVPGQIAMFDTVDNKCTPADSGTNAEATNNTVTNNIQVEIPNKANNTTSTTPSDVSNSQEHDSDSQSEITNQSPIESHTKNMVNLDLEESVINKVSLKYITNILEGISQSIAILQSELKDIKQSTKLETKQKYKNDTLVDIDEVLTVLGSKKSKKSVNINEDLIEKIKIYIKSKYNVGDNDSLIINIALLLALYKK